MKKQTKAEPWTPSWTAHFNVPTAAFPGHIIKTTDYPHLPIALIWEGGGTHGKPAAIANTYLMTASPDLLAACRMALADRFGHDDPCIDRDPITNALRAAIAKAEGR